MIMEFLGQKSEYDFTDEMTGEELFTLLKEMGDGGDILPFSSASIIAEVTHDGMDTQGMHGCYGSIGRGTTTMFIDYDGKWWPNHLQFTQFVRGGLSGMSAYVRLEKFANWKVIIDPDTGYGL